MISNEFSAGGLDIRYEVPSVLQMGYGGAKSEFTFSRSHGPDKYYPLGPDAREQTEATYYRDVKGDFADWSTTVAVFGCKFEGGVPPIESLAAYIKLHCSVQYVLKDGGKINSWSSVVVTELGDRAAVLCESTDEWRGQSVELQNGVKMVMRPMLVVYVPISKDIVFGIRILDYKRNRRVAWANEMKKWADDIVSSLRISVSTP